MEGPLRLFLGIILGIILTIGTAYVADALRPDDAAARPMVNWDVVDQNLHGISERIQDGWARLTNRNRTAG